MSLNSERNNFQSSKPNDQSRVKVEMFYTCKDAKSVPLMHTFLENSQDDSCSGSPERNNPNGDRTERSRKEVTGEKSGMNKISDILEHLKSINTKY